MRKEEWDEVGQAIGGLALKLKLHFEETADHKGKEAVDAVCDSVEAAFDGLKAAVNDPAVKQDVRDVATSLGDALRNSFAELVAQAGTTAD